MIIERPSGHQPVTAPADIEAFLAGFAQKGHEFGLYCDQYLREEVGLADITRHLSEATADAEMFFAENSFHMNMDQLQRYGMIQTTLDKRTSQLFETEITRNRQTIMQALKNGEYFIVGMSYNSIKSSIFMMYSKQKIKTDQNQKLADLEREQEATQVMIKVLKAIESVITVEDLALLDHTKIQKALEIYVNYFKNAAQVETKAACDERVFKLFEKHVDFLRSMGFGGELGLCAVHFSICCDTLQELAHNERQLSNLAAWRSLVPM